MGGLVLGGNGSVVRDYIYVADLGDALVLAAEVESRSKVLNIGSGRGTSLNELIALMAEVTGEQPGVEYRPGRDLDVPTNVLDVPRAYEELGWSARTGLAKGMEITWEWIRSVGEDGVGHGGPGVWSSARHGTRGGA